MFKGVVFIRLPTTAHLGVPHTLHLNPYIPLEAPTSTTQQNLGSYPVGLGLRGLGGLRNSTEREALDSTGLKGKEVTLPYGLQSVAALIHFLSSKLSESCLCSVSYFLFLTFCIGN